MLGLLLWQISWCREAYILEPYLSASVPHNSSTCSIHNEAAGILFQPSGKGGVGSFIIAPMMMGMRARDRDLFLSSHTFIASQPKN
jgi:hypothetical protein